MLEAAGLAERAETNGLVGSVGLPAVSVLAVTNRPGQLHHLLEQVARQAEVDLQLILVSHGFDAGEEVLARAQELGITSVEALEAPTSWSLGTCLNEAVQRADGEVCSKMDDDDIYGEFYLHDLLQARSFSGAEVVGKHAHYMYLAGTDATLLRFPWMEHRFTDRLMGPTLTAGKDVFLAHPFAPVSRGEDTAFLASVSEAGAQIYSADRFNFTQMRHGDSGGHAWSASDRELLASGDVAWFGRNDGHVML